MVTQEAILDFLSQKSLAVVGVSRSGRKFGNVAYRALKERGYTVYPVNSQADTIEGDRCFRTLRDLPEQVGGLVVVVPPIQAERIVREAIEAGIDRVWLQQGAESYAAIRQCEKHGVRVIHGHCILMFAEPVRSFHRFHRWVWSVLGKIPKGKAWESTQVPFID